MKAMEMKLSARHAQASAATIAFLVPGALAQVNHMVVIGVDGMSPDGVLKANVQATETPNLRRLTK